MATGESLAHLNCLIARGKIVRTRDAGSVDWYRRAQWEPTCAIVVNLARETAMSQGGFRFEHDPSAPQRGVTAILIRTLVSQGFAALVGFAMLILMTNLIGSAFFQGPIRDIYEVWIQFVRPVVGIPLQALADLLSEASQQISTGATDYLVVGLTVVLWQHADWSLALPRSFRDFIAGIALPILAWPLVFFLWLTSSLRVGTKLGTFEVAWILWLPPMIYGLLWYVANFYV